MARIPLFQAGTAPELYYLGWETERSLRHECVAVRRVSIVGPCIRRRLRWR